MIAGCGIYSAYSINAAAAPAPAGEQRAVRNVMGVAGLLGPKFVKLLAFKSLDSIFI